VLIAGAHVPEMWACRAFPSSTSSTPARGPAAAATHRPAGHGRTARRHVRVRRTRRADARGHPWYQAKIGRAAPSKLLPETIRSAGGVNTQESPEFDDPPRVGQRHADVAGGTPVPPVAHRSTTAEQTVSTDRKNAITVGVLFIVAAVTAILGLASYSPVIFSPDYLVKGSGHADRMILGVVFELILACSVVGTSIMLFPYLKKQNESIALGYVCFRLLEAVIIVVGTVGVLSLVTLSRDVASGGAPDASLQALGAVLIAVYKWALMLDPNFVLGMNTTMCAWLLYTSRLVPRFIARMGLGGATLILATAVLELFGIVPQVSIWGFLLAFPIFAYEMTLATWLIVKGFNSSVPVSGSGTCELRSAPA
jgi:hypothetical protein